MPALHRRVKADVPTACRQLARPDILSRRLRSAGAASGAYGIDPAEAARGDASAEPDPKPDPASIETKPSDIQVGGKQYTKVAGLTWVEYLRGSAIHKAIAVFC